MVIIGTKYGQLCNRLFLFTNVIANSLEHNYEVIYPHFDNYRHHFKNLANNNFLGYNISLDEQNLTFQNYITYKLLKIKYAQNLFKLNIVEKALNLKTIQHSDDYDFQLDTDNFVKVARDENTVLLGWCFRDERNLVKYRHNIQKLFEPRAEYLENVLDLVNSIKRDNEIIIGMHIRRGDYKRWMGGQYFFDDQSVNVILKRFNNILCELNKSVAYILCSNEKLNLNAFNKYNTFSGSGHFIEDLYLLARCDYIIGPPSTYSMWASYYGNKPLYHIYDNDFNFNLRDFRTFPFI